jgi:hypothetical protein
MGNRSTKKSKETPRLRSLKRFRTVGGSEWSSFHDVHNAKLNCMNQDNHNLLSLIENNSIQSIKDRVSAVKSWVDFSAIFSDFSDILLTIPLPPCRLPTIEQAEIDLDRELFSVFVPKQHLPKKRDTISPRKSIVKDNLHARVVGKKFDQIETLLNESYQRLVDASTVTVSNTMQEDSWEEIIDSTTATTTTASTMNTNANTDTKTSTTNETCTNTTTNFDNNRSKNLDPSDLLKCASSRTLAGGDSYFVIQEMFATSTLLVTPSHTETQGAIEIYIYDSGVVSIRTKSVFDIRSAEQMDGKEMVEIFVEHIMNIDLFHNCMRRHLLIESPSSKLAVDLSDMMGL